VYGGNQLFALFTAKSTLRAKPDTPGTPERGRRPRELGPPPPTYLLSHSDQNAEFQIWNAAVEQWLGSTKRGMLQRLRLYLTDASAQRMTAFFEAAPDAISNADFRRIMAYFDWARMLNIPVVCRSPASIRANGRDSACPPPLICSPLLCCCACALVVCRRMSIWK
jgi:hypothetical protein